MNENKQVFTHKLGEHEITVETGRLAKQTNGSVLISSHGTQVLATVCSSNSVKDGQDFFPLTVDYNEKFWAAGKFLGGFMKREARPTTGETLNARLIDRPIRPLFPEGYMYDTFIQVTCYSYDENADPEVLGALGAACALSISDLPFNGPMGTLKVGRIDGKFIINPKHEEWENSDIELVVSATKDAIMMVEGEGQQVPESDMMEALDFAHNELKKWCEFVDGIVKQLGKPKREFVSASANNTLMDKVRSSYTDDARAALNISDKIERQNAISAIIDQVSEAIKADPASFGFAAEPSAGKEAYKAVDALLYEMMRNDILKESKRIGGRATDKVRPIEVETGVLATPHGSALFTRGETQVLAAVTLGGQDGDQRIERIQGSWRENFYLHYSFPPFSVGEPRGIFKVGRRELGHGNLAERALKNILKRDKDSNYTIRMACEVLESNGSSSMGSVCSGSMALMDAGIPMESAVAGIAMGLVKEGSEYKILSDILGDEDHLGDMDFKVAGTEKGITAIQMDIKITGITRQIFEEALEQARKGRLHILGEMGKVINESRSDYKEGVPRMKSLKINPDKIGALIGPGGKNIKGIQETYDVSIEVDEDGTVKVLSPITDVLETVSNLIDMQINGPKIGTDYESEVKTIKEYGAFVDIAPGVSGLVHVSEFADERVKDVNEYVSEGDTIMVRVIEKDKMGRIKLSAKAVKPLEKKS